MLSLRPYQEQALAAIRKKEREVRRQLVVHPTGAGKTVTFSHLIAERADQGRSIVLVHRDELVHQTVDKMQMIAPELRCGVVKRTRNEVCEDVVIASVQTAMRDNRLVPLAQQGFSTVIVDEAHHAVAPSWMRVMNGLNCFEGKFGPLTVGFTATPERDKDGGLGDIWEEVVAYRTIREMIFEGYLSPVASQTVDTSADFSSVKTRGGDLLASELGDAMDSTVIEEIAAAYATYAPLRKGVAFTPTVDTAHRLADALMARGISAEPVWGAMPPEQRRGALRRLRTGETQVVTNCAVLTEGFDEPSVDCILIARPTKSHPLYIQMVGRGLRKFPGKQDCLVLDVVGVTERHDLVAIVDLGRSWVTGKSVSDAIAQDLGEESHAFACELCGRPSFQRRHMDCRAARTGSMQTLLTSKMRWLEVPGGYCLGTDTGVILMAPAGGEEDLWQLAEFHARRGVERLHASIPADWAQGIGEDRAKAFGRLSRRDARWLSEEPTPAQLNRLTREGLPEEKLPAIKTRGQAADLITRIQGRRAMKKLEAA